MVKIIAISLTALLLSACQDAGSRQVSCGVLLEIRTIPFRGDLGRDVSYDLIANNMAAYRSCLLEAAGSSVLIADPSEAPKVSGYAVGDLAYDVLAQTGQISFGDCIPSDVLTQMDRVGRQALQDWRNRGGSRAQVQRCLKAKLGSNNSFKPNPLRGSA